MSFLLDTNIISELRKKMRAHASVIAWTLTTERHQMHTSVLVIGELRRGVELKRRYDPRQAEHIDTWLNELVLQFDGRILPVDETIAQTWGRMGVPKTVPDVDGLIAATAKVHQLTLVTRERTAAARFGVEVVNPFAYQ